MQKIKFDRQGLVPGIIQDDRSGRVLTLSYFNAEALRKTVSEGKVYVYRRSQGRVMMKGVFSGHTQEVRTLHIDCEGKSILLRVRAKVASCHKGYFSCYFGRLTRNGSWTQSEKRVFDPKKVYKTS